MALLFPLQSQLFQALPELDFMLIIYSIYHLDASLYLPKSDKRPQKQSVLTFGLVGEITIIDL